MLDVLPMNTETGFRTIHIEIYLIINLSNKMGRGS